MVQVDAVLSVSEWEQLVDQFDDEEVEVERGSKKGSPKKIPVDGFEGRVVPSVAMKKIVFCRLSIAKIA